MIAFLSGIIKAKMKNSVIINTGNVGYNVFVYLDLYSMLQEGKKIELYIYTIVREQELSLYGFSSIQERQFFELLISVSGIGPKTAIGFFNLPIDSIKDAISTGDVDYLSKIKGLGKKTAEKLIVELKSKVGEVKIFENLIIKDSKEGNYNTAEDVVLALEGLGYDKMTIVKKFKNAPKFNTTEEAVIWFLRG